jgi:hypothetical protein
MTALVIRRDFAGREQLQAGLKTGLYESCPLPAASYLTSDPHM